MLALVRIREPCRIPEIKLGTPVCCISAQSFEPVQKVLQRTSESFFSQLNRNACIFLYTKQLSFSVILHLRRLSPKGISSKAWSVLRTMFKFLSWKYQLFLRSEFKWILLAFQSAPLTWLIYLVCHIALHCYYIEMLIEMENVKQLLIYIPNLCILHLTPISSMNWNNHFVFCLFYKISPRRLLWWWKFA